MQEEQTTMQEEPYDNSTSNPKKGVEHQQKRSQTTQKNQKH
jgi:hypothetical protein